MTEATTNGITPSKKIAGKERAAAEAPPTRQTLNDLSSDAFHLHALLNVATTMLIQDVDAVSKPGEPNVMYNQVTSLFWIARDLSEKLANDLEKAI